MIRIRNPELPQWSVLLAMIMAVIATSAHCVHSARGWQKVAQLTIRMKTRMKTISGLDGDELVMKVREINFTTGYPFQWETPGRQDDANAPLLMLELDEGINPVGRPVQSTLSQDALIGLRDNIAGSIRLRPTAPQVASTGEQLCSASFRKPPAKHEASPPDLRRRCSAAQRVRQAAEPSQPTA